MPKRGGERHQINQRKVMINRKKEEETGMYKYLSNSGVKIEIFESIFLI
jgi:hypothetical protein